MSPAAWGDVELKDGGLVLTYAQPCPPISTNRANTMHHMARRGMTAPWRDVAMMMTRWALAKLARDGKRWEPEPVTIRLVLSFRQARRRDPHNYVGTVVKATVDGLVRGGLIPDDTPEWATVVEPTLVIQPDATRPLMVEVHITPRSTA
jgi:hypothetical protein